jgi:AcrR family transcriptional regulator
MARPKSSDKQKAILDAAVTVFARRGVWQTPTSAISQAAGVAEGTLFTYFATKDVLVNELYRALKLELAEVMMSDFPSEDVRSQFQHVWDRYVLWGVANPDKRQVMAQLAVSERITAESRAVGEAPFAELERAAAESMQQQALRSYPGPLIRALAIAMMEATIALIAQAPAPDADYRELGFEIFWRGIAQA